MKREAGHQRKTSKYHNMKPLTHNKAKKTEMCFFQHQNLNQRAFIQRKITEKSTQSYSNSSVFHKVINSKELDSFGAKDALWMLSLAKAHPRGMI